MPDDTAQPVYAQAAAAYWEAGWRGVLPVGAGPGQKWPPPPGYTGRHADDPSRADVQAWIEGPEADRNIGLRLPPGVIGLDVDAYAGKRGGETLAQLVQRWGPLPPTWASSARDDGVSGIRLYRVPDLGAARHWPGEAGPNIEIIQHGHRYAIVWPSVNPEAAAAVYRWRFDSAVYQRLPRAGDLPELPAAWVDGLALAGPVAEKADMALGDLANWWAGLPEGAFCGPVEKVLAAVDWSGGSRHETARDAARAIVAFGAEGHRGAPAALGVLGRRFVEAVRADRGDDAAAAEWRRLLIGAVRLAARAHPAPKADDPCGLLAGTGVQFTAPPDFSGASTPPVGAIEATADPPPPAGQSMLDVLRSELLTPEQIKARPNPVPLVAGLLDMDTLAWLIAEPGSYKSFVALDLAGHVAGGQPWQGRRVRRGSVLYLVAEGATGMTLRVRAWESEHGPMDQAVHFLPRPVLVKNEPAWLALVELVRELAPALVVLDTQARVTTGLEENSATEMGLFVHAAEALRMAAGSCVLVIHHTARAGGNARGSSAIDGAQGTELKLTKRDDLIAELSLDKQKDAADDAVIALKLRRVDQGADPETGRDLSSLVVCKANPFGQPGGRVAPPRDWEDNATPNQALVVEVLRDHSDAAGASHTEARGWIRERLRLRGQDEMPRTSYNSAVVALAKLGVIVRDGVSRIVLAEHLPPIDDDA